jgi:hypothetical protein
MHGRRLARFSLSNLGVLLCLGSLLDLLLLQTLLLGWLNRRLGRHRRHCRLLLLPLSLPFSLDLLPLLLLLLELLLLRLLPFDL